MFFNANAINMWLILGSQLPTYAYLCASFLLHAYLFADILESSCILIKTLIFEHIKLHYFNVEKETSTRYCETTRPVPVS